MKKQEYEDFTLTFDDSDECKQRCYDLLLAFYEKHQAFNGESIMQCDGPQIEAPELLSEIAETAFRFDPKWKEEL